jgi:hypothetical protein
VAMRQVGSGGVRCGAFDAARLAAWPDATGSMRPVRPCADSISQTPARTPSSQRLRSSAGPDRRRCGRLDSARRWGELMRHVRHAQPDAARVRCRDHWRERPPRRDRDRRRGAIVVAMRQIGFGRWMPRARAARFGMRNPTLRRLDLANTGANALHGATAIVGAARLRRCGRLDSAGGCRELVRHRSARVTDAARVRCRDHRRERPPRHGRDRRSGRLDSACRCGEVGAAQSDTRDRCAAFERHHRCGPVAPAATDPRLLLIGFRFGLELATRPLHL